VIKKVSLSAMTFSYLFIGIAHFLYFDYFLNLVPIFMPTPKALVALTGTLEILLAVLLAFPLTRRGACFSILFLLALAFPFNIYLLAVNGAGSNIPHSILVARVPFQLFLMLWAYWHSRLPASNKR
jgi:uncharacterized membrane protein